MSENKIPINLSAVKEFVATRRIWVGWLILLLLISAGCVSFLLLEKSPSAIGLDAKLQAGIKPSLKDFVADGEWKACALNLGISLLLLGTLRWWTRPIEVQSANSRWTPRWTWMALLLIVAAAGWLRGPRLTHSLWNDEEYTLRTYAWGITHVEDDGSLHFKKTDLRTLLWHNRGANNHVPFTLAARCSLEIWEAFGNSDDRLFSEAALRFPAFIAGLGSVCFAGWMLATRGHPILGLFTAAFLALHPWHLRYSVEARGYAFLLLFVLAAFHFLERAIERPGWRNFLWFGFFQFLALYSFPGAVYLFVALNLVASVDILMRHGWRKALPILARLCVANAFAAMVFIQLMMPCARQIQLYLQRDIAQSSMTWTWWLDFWSHLVCGSRWEIPNDGNPRIVSGLILFSEYVIFRLVAFVVLPAFAIFGVLRALFDRSVPHLFVWTPVLAIIGAYAHTSITGNFLFSWYGIYVLLGLAFALTAAVHGVAILWRGGVSPQRVEGLLGFVLLILLGLATLPAIHAIRAYPRQPIREAVAVAFEGVDSFSATPPDIFVASVGTSAGHFRSYAPRIRDLSSRDAERNTADLESLMQEAQRDGKRLRLICGGMERLRSTQARLSDLIERSGNFEEVQRVDGLEELFSLRIFEYSPRGDEHAP